jgi:hypothetical protein
MSTNLETFTLGNLFAMRLNRFSHKVGEIVDGAMQEIKVKQEIPKTRGQCRARCDQIDTMLLYGHAGIPPPLSSPAYY